MSATGRRKDRFAILAGARCTSEPTLTPGVRRALAAQAFENWASCGHYKMMASKPHSGPCYPESCKNVIERRRKSYFLWYTYITIVYDIIVNFKVRYWQELGRNCVKKVSPGGILAPGTYAKFGFVCSGEVLDRIIHNVAWDRPWCHRILRAFKFQILCLARNAAGAHSDIENHHLVFRYDVNYQC